MQEAARTQLAINSYLQQFDHPQMAFDVKQKCPNTINEIISATLEMESYITAYIARWYSHGRIDCYRRCQTRTTCNCRYRQYYRETYFSCGEAN